jgi:hypothetical protein
MDRCRLPSVRRSPSVPATRYFPRQVVTPAHHEEASETRARDSLMGEMHRAISREEQERKKQDRFASTLVIAASIIAAVRLARDDISRPSPRLTSVIADSVQACEVDSERSATVSTRAQAKSCASAYLSTRRCGWCANATSIAVRVLEKTLHSGESRKHFADGTEWE